MLTSLILPLKLDDGVWTRKVPKEPLPRTLKIEDYDDIIQSKCFFCRKISVTQSAELLDKLDELRKG